MVAIKIVWDSKKALRNRRKHGVSFEEAASVFYDDFAQLIPDPDHSEDEERFLILGRSSFMNLLVVCHCYRENDQVIRIFSARMANSTESKWYPDPV